MAAYIARNAPCWYARYDVVTKTNRGRLDQGQPCVPHTDISVSGRQGKRSPDIPVCASLAGSLAVALGVFTATNGSVGPSCRRGVGRGRTALRWNMARRKVQYGPASGNKSGDVASSMKDGPEQSNAQVVQDRLQAMREMRARDLKKELETLGLSTAGCTDKESLLDILNQRGEALVEYQIAQAEVAKRQRDAKRAEYFAAREAAAELVYGNEDENPYTKKTPGSVRKHIEQTLVDERKRREEIHKKRKQNYRPYAKG